MCVQKKLSNSKKNLKQNTILDKYWTMFFIFVAAHFNVAIKMNKIT